MGSQFDRRLKMPCVYILASKPDGVLYVGVTSDIRGRMFDHATGTFEGFTKQHNVKQLVYYEHHDTMDAAIAREKRIKEWQRAWKVRLIIGFNPAWTNLFNLEQGTIADGPADLERERSHPYRQRD
jgi:putative endonuclease